MRSQALLNRLNGYIEDLEGIRSRFKQTATSLNIDDEDEPRVQQICLELRDMLDDAMPKNAYGLVVMQAYHAGIANFYESPSYDSIQKITAIARAAKTRIEMNTELIDAAPPLGAEDAAATQTEQKSLTMPDKVTLAWLYHHVPFGLWVAGASTAASFFTLGMLAVSKFPSLSRLLSVACAPIQ
jgi:hypothetical protein